MSKIDPQKVIDHLKKTWGNEGRCPMCGKKDWRISDTIYELREYHGGPLVTGPGLLVPLVPVTCGFCGNTVQVNAIAAGVTEMPKREKEEKNG